MIAVDAMGGDHAPHSPVKGAILAARAGVQVALFGDATVVIPELQICDPEWSRLPLQVVHCAEAIGMADVPTRAVLRKRDASLIRAMQAVLDGQATAVVTAGNSGAALVAGTLLFDRIPGIDRPALGRMLPTKTGAVFCLDLGVNADCKPEYLVQFALMGQAYVRVNAGNCVPRIGLLSNGHEPYKGSLLVKATYDLLSRLPIHFVGNIEARDLFDDLVDVIVSDGFSGNVLLKTAQGTANVVAHWLEQEGNKHWLGALCMRFFGSSVIARLRAKTDYANQAGALLLGLNHPLFVAHGCATYKAIERSILEAHALVNRGFITEFNQEVVRLLPLTHVPNESQANINVGAGDGLAMPWQQ